MIKHFWWIGLAVVWALAACATTANAPAGSAVTVSDAWARVSAPTDTQSSGMSGMAKVNGAAYMSITNAGAADRLLKAESDVAEAVELHNVTEEAGVMQMRPVPAIEIPASGSVQLKPGGYHVMMIGLKKELKAGDIVALKLMFEKAGVQQLQVPVKAQ